MESIYYPLVHDVKSTEYIHRCCLQQSLSKTVVEKILPNLFTSSFCNAVCTSAEYKSLLEAEAKP